jgi:hypothetical protein
MRGKSLLALVLLAPLFALQALAVCPVCTIAVGAGVGLLRAYGVDDLITGLWVGALILSSIMWFLNWLEKKHYSFRYKEVIIAVLFYALFLIPLDLMHVIGHPNNRLWGVDKLLIGTILGSLIFFASVAADKYLRTINGKKVVFPYQKVVVPLAFLALASAYMYFIVRIFL